MEKTEKKYFDHFLSEAQLALATAAVIDERISLGADGEPREASKELVVLLERLLTEARKLRDHAHEWAENGYCEICGADGHA
jgi:hypothetical protein